MENVTSPQVIKNQYGTDGSLDIRIRVKKRFSTSNQGWGSFLLQNFCLKPDNRILELGCGNAVFWKAVADRLPTGIKLTLSDFSEGMLEAAKGNTNGLSFIENYAVIDAQSLPYSDNSFDVIIANYMLYHVPNVQKALSEISRILRPNGFFFAATFGKDNLKEVTDIFHDYDNRIDSVLNEMVAVFGLENGGGILGKYFNSVEMEKFENNLHITEFDSLLDYFLSYRGMGNISEIISDVKLEQFSDYINRVFSEKSYIDITQEEGLFVSSLPIK
ncbi:MAG: class I SAM-dependent methyltransferase [Oscillospiraceae bacterium]|nr:class I SAM-dependent methyltransferase [Oscillospiraceae bacterium]